MVIGTSANRSPVIRRSALGLLGASTKSAQRFAAVLDGSLHDARLYGTSDVSSRCDFTCDAVRW